MKYFLIAGEASGDLHTSTIMKELRRQDVSASFTYMGGAKMRELGGTCVVPSEHIAYMGVVDVIKNIGQIETSAKRVQVALLETTPDVVICTDYASFCFRYILPFVRRHLPHTKIVYYIPPKVWAWKKGRIKKLRSHTDLILSIFPFEIPFYKEYSLPQVRYIGNPSLEEVQHFLTQYTSDEQPPYIALLPGSRKSEVEKNLPTMLKVALSCPDLNIKIAGTSSLPKEVYGTLNQSRCQLVIDDTYRVVKGATAALVTSGTATLETALLSTPQVVCYAHGFGQIANWVFEHLFTTPYISLVNLIADKPVVKELFGNQFTEEKIWSALAPLLHEGKERQEILAEYAYIRELLDTAIPSSEMAANAIIKLAE